MRLLSLEIKDLIELIKDQEVFERDGERCVSEMEDAKERDRDKDRDDNILHLLLDFAKLFFHFQ